MIESAKVISYLKAVLHDNITFIKIIGCLMVLLSSTLANAEHNEVENNSPCSVVRKKQHVKNRGHQNNKHSGRRQGGNVLQNMAVAGVHDKGKVKSQLNAVTTAINFKSYPVSTLSTIGDAFTTLDFSFFNKLLLDESKSELSKKKIMLFKDGATSFKKNNTKYSMRAQVKPVSKQLWGNLSVVLDLPLNKVGMSRLTSKYKKMSEHEIEQFNEAQVNYAYLVVLKYLLYNAHALIGKPAKQLVTIDINLVNEIDYDDKQLIKLLNMLAGSLKVEHLVRDEMVIDIVEENIKLKFNANIKNSNEDIVLVINLLAGLNKDSSLGDLLIPVSVIPFDVANMELHFDKFYNVNNLIAENIAAIVDSQCVANLEFINDNYRSSNPKKIAQVARLLTQEDFKRGILLSGGRHFTNTELAATFKAKLD